MGATATPAVLEALRVRERAGVRLVLALPGPLPGLNEILRAKGASYVPRLGTAPARRPNGYNTLKRQWSHTIKLIAHAEQLRPVGPSAFTWVWLERDKRRDPSNLTSGGRKLIEDALLEAGILAGDGWQHVLDLRDHWLVMPGRVGVVVIAAERVLERDEALALVTGRPAAWQRLATPATPKRRR